MQYPGHNIILLIYERVYSLYLQQQQQRLIPLGGVGYMDQLPP